MRSGSEQKQVAVLISGKALQQFEAQLLTGAAAGAGVRFIDNDAFWSRRQELLAVAFALDVVQTHNDHRVVIEQAHTMRELSFHPGC